MDVMIGDVKLTNCEVDIILEKYSRRDFQEDVDGDDMVDIGRKSYEFEIRGQISFQRFKMLDAEVRKTGNVLTFAFGEFKIVVKRLVYRSSGAFTLTVIEDVV